MALDVHVLDDPKELVPTGLPSCQFEETVHAYIFHGAGVDIYNRYPLLRRMIDFYADASYTAAELESLVSEIDDLLPFLTAWKGAAETLESFRQICFDARRCGKVVMLYCD